MKHAGFAAMHTPSHHATLAACVPHFHRKHIQLLYHDQLCCVKLPCKDNCCLRIALLICLSTLYLLLVNLFAYTAVYIGTTIKLRNVLLKFGVAQVPVTFIYGESDWMDPKVQFAVMLWFTLLEVHSALSQLCLRICFSRTHCSHHNSGLMRGTKNDCIGNGHVCKLIGSEAVSHVHKF